MTTLKHRASNRINKILVDHCWIDNQEELNQEAIRYFFTLLSNDGPLDVNAQDEILWDFSCTVSQDMNKELNRIPSHDEVRVAVFSFEGNKFPGPDGFPMFFFQTFWQIIGSDVGDVAREFFGSKSLLKELNATFFVSIPKKPDASSFQDFRPISLCNSTYKIFTKIIVFRLKNFLPSLISKHQNGFILGR